MRNITDSSTLRASLLAPGRIMLSTLFLTTLVFSSASCSRLGGITSKGTGKLLWTYTPLDPGQELKQEDLDYISGTLDNPSVPRVPREPRELLHEKYLTIRDGKGRVHVLDAGSGTELWCGPEDVRDMVPSGGILYTLVTSQKNTQLPREEYEKQSPFSSTSQGIPMRFEGNLYPMLLKALDLETGREQWSTRSWGKSPSPRLAVLGEHAIVYEPWGGWIQAFDSSTGRGIWGLGEGPVFCRSKPAIGESSIFLELKRRDEPGKPGTNPYLVTLDSASGLITTRIEIPDTDGRPEKMDLFPVKGGAVAIGSIESEDVSQRDVRLFELQLSKTSPLYGLELGRRFSPGQDLVRGTIVRSTDQKVFVSTVTRNKGNRESLLFSINRSSGSIDWVLSFDSPVEQFDLSNTDSIYGATGNSLFLVEGGKKKWEKTFPCPFDIIPVEDELIACCESMLISINRSDGSVTGRLPLGETPLDGAVRDGILYCVTSKYRVLAVSLPLDPHPSGKL